MYDYSVAATETKDLTWYCSDSPVRVAACRISGPNMEMWPLG